jgi:hypothetical protein
MQGEDTCTFSGDAVDSSVSFDILYFAVTFSDDLKAECKVRIREFQGTTSNPLYTRFCFAVRLRFASR